MGQKENVMEGKVIEDLDTRIKDAIARADDAFWAEIAKAFPEVKTGDFPPDLTVDRWNNNFVDIACWVALNEKY